MKEQSIIEELQLQLKVVEEMEAKEKRHKFITENKFNLLKEQTFLLYNVCPDCFGEGGTWEKCYHSNAEWIKCKRCDSTGSYNTGHLTQFLNELEEVLYKEKKND